MSISLVQRFGDTFGSTDRTAPLLCGHRRFLQDLVSHRREADVSTSICQKLSLITAIWSSRISSTSSGIIRFLLLLTGARRFGASFPGKARTEIRSTLRELPSAGPQLRTPSRLPDRRLVPYRRDGDKAEGTRGGGAVRFPSKVLQSAQRISTNNYGTGIWHAFAVLLVVIAALSCLFLLTGFREAGGSEVIRYIPALRIPSRSLFHDWSRAVPVDYLYCYITAGPSV